MAGGDFAVPEQLVSVNGQPAAVALQDSLQPENTAPSSEKCCQRCGESHPLRMFPVSRSSPDGRHPLCFVCRWEDRAERWPRKPRCRLHSGR